MMAVTVRQPWASLAMAGAVSWLFQRRRLPDALIGQRIVIHAGRRPVRTAELVDLIEHGGLAGLLAEGRLGTAMDILEREWRCRGTLPLAGGLGTVLAAGSKSAAELDDIRVGVRPRISAWLVGAPEPFPVAVPMPAGRPGLWRWPEPGGAGLA